MAPLISNQGLAQFTAYVEETETAARKALVGDLRVAPGDPNLDGAASRELRARVDLVDRRAAGAFFTTSFIRDGAFAMALDRSPVRAALDAACGGGDLLLASSSHLAVASTLARTLDAWAPLLEGVDTQPEFVRLARARIVLAAAARVPKRGATRELESCLPRLACGDGLDRLRSASLPEHVVLNPPFNVAAAPSWYTAGAGLVSQAAVFVSAWLAGAIEGQRLVALIPDVLRTGARYAKWRSEVEASATIEGLESLGQFDSDVDIDVVLLALRRSRAQEANWWGAAPTVPRTPRATVSVGAVVPHRDAVEGPVAPYLTTANLPRVAKVNAPDETRRFAGTLMRPPFVAVRRTSRPGQRPRAAATVVEGDAPIAVENHLLVVRPTSGSVDDCLTIAVQLEADASSAWFDERMRGRHLSVTALQELLGQEE